MESERKSRYELWLEEEERKAQPNKRCSVCKETKLCSEFHKQRTACKLCVNQARRDRRVRKYKSHEDRFWKTFWKKAVRMPSGCLEWTGRYNSNGCPLVTWEGKQNASLRRVVYRLALSEINDEVFVITTCNNSRCVSQYHMKAATKEEFYAKTNNLRPTGDSHWERQKPERVKRGDCHWSRLRPERWAEKNKNAARGARNGTAKLTESSVQSARKQYACGASISKLARLLGISRGTLRSAIRGETWKHVE